MPFQEASVMDARIRFVLKAIDRDRSFSILCREFGISRPTGYLWLRRYRESGTVLDLRERSRRPRRIPRQTSSDVVDHIASLRLAYHWGARKLQVLLANDGISVSESTINRILKRSGFVRRPEVVGHATKRFERSSPNELWQMDFKGPYLVGTGRCNPLSLLDDHSRFAIGLFALDNQLASTVHSCLVSSFERYGLPEAILTDHGVPWWSSNGHGLTWLSVAIIKQGVRLIFSGIRHPQTQGKVERFHRTLNDTIRHRGRPDTLTGWKCALGDFVSEYNHIRPHESLGMAVPSSRYYRSSREYQPAPSDWDYPAGATVVRLNSQGVLPWKGYRYFVCEALAGEDVEVKCIEHNLVVRFRNMWIREIDTKTNRSVTLIDKKRNPYV